jgi:hypothetical protein
MGRSPHGPDDATAADTYDRPVTSSGVRLSELLAAMSLATDLGLGQPPEHMLRAARIGMRLGERLGLDTDALATLYDVSVLTYVGCPVYGNEIATVFGDDIDFRSHASEVDLAGFSAMIFMLRRAAPERPRSTGPAKRPGSWPAEAEASSSRWPTTAPLPGSSPSGWG